MINSQQISNNEQTEEPIEPHPIEQQKKWGDHLKAVVRMIINAIYENAVKTNICFLTFGASGKKFVCESAKTLESGVSIT